MPQGHDPQKPKPPHMEHPRVIRLSERIMRIAEGAGDAPPHRAQAEAEIRATIAPLIEHDRAADRARPRAPRAPAAPAVGRLAGGRGGDAEQLYSSSPEFVPETPDPEPEPPLLAGGPPAMPDAGLALDDAIAGNYRLRQQWLVWDLLNSWLDHPDAEVTLTVRLRGQGCLRPGRNCACVTHREDVLLTPGGTHYLGPR